MPKIRTTQRVELRDGNEIKVNQIVDVVSGKPDRDKNEISEQEANDLVGGKAAERVRAVRMLDHNAGYNTGERAVVTEIEAQKLIAAGRSVDAEPPQRDGPARKTKPATPSVRKG